MEFHLSSSRDISPLLHGAPQEVGVCSSESQVHPPPTTSEILSHCLWLLTFPMLFRLSLPSLDLFVWGIAQIFTHIQHLTRRWPHIHVQSYTLNWEKIFRGAGARLHTPTSKFCFLDITMCTSGQDTWWNKGSFSVKERHVWVCWGCQDKVPQIWGLKQHKCIVS